MTVRQKIYRTSSLGARPAAATRDPGELYVNFPEGQLGVVDENQDPIDLVAVRYFSTLAIYAVGDVVFNILDNKLYQCIIANGPGPFTATDWQLALDSFPQRLSGYETTGLHTKYLGDLNSILVNSNYALSATDVLNEPVDFTNDGFVLTNMWSDSTFGVQTITGMTGSSIDKIWTRARASGAWGPWSLIVGFTPPVPDEVETGTVIMWPLDTPPAGYLSCIGQEVGRTTFPDLFALLGTVYGIGDGSTTFNIPDYRGQFLRGTDNARGLDPDAAARLDRGDGITGDNVGTTQVDEIRAHNHPFTAQQNLGGFTDNGSAPDQKSAAAVRNTSNTGGNETRPTNININFAIKT